MKFRIPFFAFLAFFTISCKKENTKNVTTESQNSQNQIQENDSVKMHRYFLWQEKIEKTGYKEYDSLALEKIELPKDLTILNRFIDTHPDIETNYEFEDNPRERLFQHLHIIDINGDAKNDIIYQGYSGGEPQITQIFLNNDNEYEKVFTQYQNIHSLKFENNKLVSFKIANPGCCADPQFVEHQYSVTYNKEKPQFRLDKSVGFYIGMEKVKLKYDKPKDFTIVNHGSRLRVDTYILDNVEHPLYGPEGNVISDFQKGIKGKAIGYKNQDGITWINVLLPIDNAFTDYDYHNQKNIPSYTYGWILKSDTDLK